MSTPTIDNQIKFRFGTSTEYNALLSKDSDSLYFLTDTHEIYLGSDSYGSAVDLSNYYTKAEIDNAAAAYTPTSNLAAVALSGEYSDLLNLPTVRDNVRIITNVNGWTYQQFVDLINNNILPVLLRNGIYYYPQYDGGSSGSLFFYPLKKDGEFVYFRIQATDNAQSWSSTYVLPERSSSIDYNLSSTPISASSTDGQIPTSKAVYEAIPTNVSDLNNDSGFISSYTETDPVFSASAAAGITSTDISDWSAKQDALVSGVSIKTINGESVLGSGNISVSGGGGGGDVNVIEVVKVNDTALPVTNKAVNIDLTGYAELSDIPSLANYPTTSDMNTAIGTATTNMVTATTALTSDNILLGSGNKVATSSGKTIVTSLTGSSNVPTDAAIQTYISGLNYIDSTELATELGSYALSSQIPTDTSDLNNDSGFITSADVPTNTSDLVNDGADGTSTYVEASSLATVATSGRYADLTGTPTNVSTFNNDAGYVAGSSVTTGAVGSIANGVLTLGSAVLSV